MQNVCVFMSANDIAEKYTKPALQLAALLVENNYGFVYGGSDTGLMKKMSTAVQVAGGDTVGVSMEILAHVAKPDATEMTICKDLAHRKKVFDEKCDAYIILVGGIGTLDEASEIIALKKHGLHQKPIIFLDTDNFYAGLRLQLQKMDEEGFLRMPLPNLITFAHTPAEVIETLHNTLKN